MPTRVGRNRRTAFALVALLLVATAGFFALDEWRRRTALEEARRDLAAGRFAEARARLASLSGSVRDDGEAAYGLGVSEEGLGHEEAARKAWDGVPPGSPFAGRAALRRARQELKRHRFAPAERLMTRALSEPGAAGVEALETLVNLFKIQGRFAEAKRLLRSSADRYPDRIGLLKELAQIDSINPYALGRTRQALDRAAAASPDDERVWLGNANYATRTGDFGEAAKWLARCESAVRNDPAVVRGRLALALAQDDPDAAGDALRWLPRGSIEADEALDLRAWFAARTGDAEVERQALAGLLKLAPDNLRAVERLAELELKAGNADEAARLRKRKAELDRAKARYQIALFGPEPEAQAAVMAGLAETLGRPLEERILWKLVLRRRPGDPQATEALAKLDAAPPPPAPDPTDVLADLAAARAPQSSGTDPAAGASPAFTDDAEKVGLKFTFENGVSPLRQLPETMSGGVALLDYDGDGWLDVYCVQGGPFPPDPKTPPPGDRLFRNKGDGTFEDATDRSGIAAMPRGYGHGVAVGDYDDDGRPDLFVTRWRSYALYHNEGGGRFRDATADAGFAGDRDWPTSAAFADLDGDGDLDLYVCHYLDWDSDHPQPCFDPKKKAYVYCGPPRFRSMPDHVFRNDKGKFVDVTAEWGFVDPHGQGLGVVANDFDGDGKVDVFVANDQSANYLYRNLGGFSFEETGETSGVASSADGVYQASMGVGCGDPDGDGRPDLVVTNFYNEGTTLYRNLGGGVFVDHTASTGLMVATRYMLGFGVAFLDFDADGVLDVASVNGHVDDFRPEEPYMMPAQLLAGSGKNRYVDVSDRAGPLWKVLRLGRGLAAGDLDNDGRVDLVMLSQNAPLAYAHNRTEGGRTLTLRLEGTASNRDAVGAKVTVKAGGRTQTAWRFGGGSYQSSSDPRLNFGLGTADRADEVEVVWPSGKAERFGPLEADAGYRLKEGRGSAGSLEGFSGRASVRARP